QQTPEAGAGFFLQLIGARLPHPLDRGVDATAASSDLLVAQALEAIFELVVARAGEDKVRMTVNQSREHGFVRRIDKLSVQRHLGCLGGLADPIELAVAEGERAAFDHGQIAHGPTTLDAFTML